jgi:hypothetical protein
LEEYAVASEPELFALLDLEDFSLFLLFEAAFDFCSRVADFGAFLLFVTRFFVAFFFGAFALPGDFFGGVSFSGWTRITGSSSLFF